MKVIPGSFLKDRFRKDMPKTFKVGGLVVPPPLPAPCRKECDDCQALAEGHEVCAGHQSAGGRWK